jgi:mono/diheme cytochrome c family protein
LSQFVTTDADRFGNISQMMDAFQVKTHAMIGAVVIWGFCACLAVTALRAAQDAPSSTVPNPDIGQTVLSGVYNEGQAKRGESISLRKCVICHGEELVGNEAPGLVGPDFLGSWTTQTLGDLFDRTKKTMPADAPGNLSPQETADLLAYMLSLNQFPAGEKELSSDMAILSQIRITSPIPAK